MKNYPLIGIVGPTASGKTALAVQLAAYLKGDIISADSRQVYKEMDIGTGKDLGEYIINGQEIPYHLIDIRRAGQEYDVFQFQEDFFCVYESLKSQGKWTILCGGSGLYLQAALAGKKMLRVEENKALRKELKNKTQVELNSLLQELKPKLHNQTDLQDAERTIRAIEIALFEKKNNKELGSPVKKHVLFGLRTERKNLRERIKIRLDKRLEEGMIEEVENLKSKGVTSKSLNYYGLEYRFINAYLVGKIPYNEMYNSLLQGIRRFAKKQETWFRRMEKQGYQINWMEVESSMNEKLSFIKQQISKHVS